MNVLDPEDLLETAELITASHLIPDISSTIPTGWTKKRTNCEMQKNYYTDIIWICINWNGVFPWKKNANRLKFQTRLFCVCVPQ